MTVDDVLVWGPRVSGVVRLGSDGSQRQLDASERQNVYVVRSLNLLDYHGIVASRAVICETGQATNHMAVVCRILGIPVVQLSHATRLFADGESVIVDAEQRCIVRSNASEFDDSTSLVPSTPHAFDAAVRYQVSIVDSSDLISRVNGLERHDVEQYFLRSELLWLSIGDHPYRYLRRAGRRATVLRIADRLAELCSSLEEGQVLNFRGLDLRSDATGFGRRYMTEANPQLGLHGVRALLARPEYLDIELSAISAISDRGHANVLYSIPFVALPSEVERVLDAGGKERLSPSRFGVFIETPASVIEIERILDLGPRALYVGTKDLAQLTLGADRDNSRVAAILSARHASITTQIEAVVAAAARRAIPAFVFVLPGDVEHLLEHAPSVTRLSVAASDYLRLTPATTL